MADLEAFEAEVKAKIKQLSAKDAATRRKAAAWLGEAGDPTAITALAQAYKNDTDPRVREAAAYSLGMFRKLEAGLQDDEERTVKVLESIALEGKMGRRVRIPARSLVKLELALLLSAALVAALAFVLPPMIRGGSISIASIPQNQPVADKDRTTLLNDLRSAFEGLSANTSELQRQYQLVLGGGSLDCDSATFTNLSPLELSSNNRRDYPDLAAAAEQINQARTDYEAAKATYDRVCEGGETVAAGEFGAPMASVVAVLQQFPAIEQALAGSIEGAASPTAPAAATATVQPTATPAGLADLRPHLIGLQAIIDDVTAPRGAYTLLNQYWNEVTTATATAGCSEPAPPIPQDYSIPQELQVSAPTLKLSADLVNRGLQALRDGWQVFSQSCASGSFAGAAVEQQKLDAVKQTLDLAGQQIAGLRG